MTSPTPHTAEHVASSPGTTSTALILLAPPSHLSTAVLSAEDSFQSWLTQEAERCATFLATIPMAKARILASLAAAGVTVLCVNYDGYGGSGQMNDFNATLTDGSTVALARGALQSVHVAAVWCCVLGHTIVIVGSESQTGCGCCRGGR